MELRGTPQSNSFGLLADWVPHEPRFMGWPARIVAIASAAIALAAGAALLSGRLGGIVWWLVSMGATGVGLGVSFGLAVRWLPRHRR